MEKNRLNRITSFLLAVGILLLFAFSKKEETDNSMEYTYYDEMMILNEKNNQITSAIDVYIVVVDEIAINTSICIADKLRNKLGIKIVCETLRRSMKSQMREANKLNAQFVIIIGENYCA